MDKSYSNFIVVLALAALLGMKGLAQDLKSCLDRYEKDLASLAEERQTGMRNLSEVYANALEVLLDQAKRDGDVDLQQAVKDEVERVSKGDLTANGDVTLKHDALKAARDKYETGMRLRDRGVARKIDDLTKTCDRSLEQLSGALARDGKQEEVTNVRVARTTLNSRRVVTWARRLLSERATASSTSVVPVPPPAVPVTSVSAPAVPPPAVQAAAANKGAPFLVIDLSAGEEAKKYPVSYLSAVPAGGWDKTHKTDRLVLRRIEPGTFIMGSPASELGHREDERQRQVTLTRAYYIGIFEVTQRQWELVMGNNPSWFKKEAAMRPVEQISYCMVRGSLAGMNWPSDNAVDETSFVGRLRSRTGLAGFDLPTEAQWEYACRAETETAINNGKNLTSCDECLNVQEVAVYRRSRDLSEELVGPEQGGSATVGSRLPNRWGLYDMHGNVLEWCLDCFGPYSDSAVDPVGAKSGSTRVLRGGPWWYYDPKCAANCRSARRYDKNPRDGGKQYGWGFRVGMTEL